MQLFLIRHADSDFVAKSDHQRPLSQLGLRQAAQSAEYLKQQIQLCHVQIICSDALRTSTTAQIIQQQMESAQLSSDNAYYDARVSDWCDGISRHHAAEHLILVGHNPIMAQLSNYLNSSHSCQFSPSCVAHYQLEIQADGLKLPAQFKDFFKPNAI